MISQLRNMIILIIFLYLMIMREERTQKLLEYYVHDEMYSRWLYSGMEMTQADMDFLRECFLETGQIVQEDKNTILINLTGLNSRNVF